MSPNESIDDCIVDLEPQYQSQQDAQIGNLLDLYGIPFLYRHPMVVEDKGQYQTIYPAFTLPSYGGVIIDYTHKIYGEEYIVPEAIMHNTDISRVAGQSTIDLANWQSKYSGHQNQSHHYMRNQSSCTYRNSHPANSLQV